MKVCIKCGLEKDNIAFSKNNNACKDCISAYNKQYRKDNLFKIKKTKAIYYENNK